MSDKGGISRTVVARRPITRQYKGANTSTVQFTPPPRPAPEKSLYRQTFTHRPVCDVGPLGVDYITPARAATDAALKLEIFLGLGASLSAPAAVGVNLITEENP
jgi:hypothetical protein